MDRFPNDAEESFKQLGKLIATRTEATENDILAGRMAVVRAVAEKTGEGLGDRSLNCDQDEAEALVRAAVLGRSALVGTRIAEVVSYAIFAYVLPLAQGDLADAERNRQQSRDEHRIDMAEQARALH